jgi:hypothetical protein
MILTDTEAKELAQDHDLPTLTIRAIEAAILAKLRAGVEAPEPFPAGYIAQSEYFVQYDEALRYGDARALAAMEQYKADAERYRWLREASNTNPSIAPTASLNNGAGWLVYYEFYGDRFKPSIVYRTDALDKAINAAMERGEGDAKA